MPTGFFIQETNDHGVVKRVAHFVTRGIKNDATRFAKLELDEETYLMVEAAQSNAREEVKEDLCHFLGVRRET